MCTICTLPGHLPCVHETSDFRQRKLVVETFGWLAFKVGNIAGNGIHILKFCCSGYHLRNRIRLYLENLLHWFFDRLIRALYCTSVMSCISSTFLCVGNAFIYVLSCIRNAFSFLQQVCVKNFLLTKVMGLSCSQLYPILNSVTLSETFDCFRIGSGNRISGAGGTVQVTKTLV